MWNQQQQQLAARLQIERQRALNQYSQLNQQINQLNQYNQMQPNHTMNTNTNMQSGLVFLCAFR